MEFDNLPENVFLQIVAYLPLKERLRIRRVNKKFQKIASILISRTKALGDWTGDEILNKITLDSFSALLKLCANNLESVEFPRVRSISDLVSRFAQFSFPRLVALDLAEASVSNRAFGNMIWKNVNLKSLTWNNDVSPVFPDDGDCEKLEILKIAFSTGEFLRSLTGRCPNLKHFETNLQRDASPQVLDEFVANCPDLQTVSLLLNIEKPTDTFVSFWRLTCLKKLYLRFWNRDHSNDGLLKKIANSFAELESLAIIADSSGMTADGISSLASLKNLRQLRLVSIASVIKEDNNVDERAGFLADCVRLESVQLDVNLTPATVRNFLQFCPRLYWVFMNRMQGIVTVEAAVALVPWLGGVCHRSVTICFRDKDHARIWKSIEVKAALKQLKEADNRVIKFA